MAIELREMPVKQGSGIRQSEKFFGQVQKADKRNPCRPLCPRFHAGSADVA
jgi:hypothetical protein